MGRSRYPAGFGSRGGSARREPGFRPGDLLGQFTAAGWRVRFVLTLPARSERRFTHSSRGARTPEVARKEWEQACRQRWRALVLVIKAKLEAVQAGIVTFEEEFLAHIVLPDDTTVYDRAREGLKLAYETGELRPMLPPPSKGGL